jgi:Ca2+-binding EF-hand superfamily protein
MDGNSSIDCAEFRGIALPMIYTPTDKDLDQAFKFFDKDNSGLISA